MVKGTGSCIIIADTANIINPTILGYRRIRLLSMVQLWAVPGRREDDNVRGRILSGTEKEGGHNYV